MKKKWLNYLYISGMLLLVSCTPKGPLDKTLSSAKENRSELQKVLKHYANDSLKLEATKFLISNMQGSYANDSNLQTVYAPFYKIYDNVRKKYNYEINKKCGEEIDSLWQVFCFVYSDELTVKRMCDAEHLTASTIISEIEMAFKAWKGNVYTQNCSFHDFCEYILPYRRENGLVIDNSRDRYYRRHHKDFYTTHGKNVMEETDSLLFLYKDIVHSPYYVPLIPILTASTFEKIKTGTCEQRCWFNSLLLSSVGMAAAVDFVPVWGNRNGGHSWNVIIVNGESYAFEAFWDDDRWKYKRIYNNKSYDSFWGKFRLPKVYRKTFSNHTEGPLSDKKVAREDIPPLFLNEKKIDVSSEYFETQDIRVILNTDSINPIPGYAYLSVYNYQDWIPVQWGKIKDQQVTFDKMGKDIVYLPTYYVKGKSIPAGQPFWLKSDGTLQNLSANGEKGQVVIRNFAGQVPFNENRKNLTSLKGGELWGMKNGKKDKLLYTITDTLQIQHQLFRIDDPMSYQFVRLYLPSPGIALGELSFYSADKLITGIQILSPLPHNNEDEKPEMLIDGLSDTAFSGEVSKGYIDFDLNNEYKLSAIGISPYIRSWLGRSNTYELSYWENEWRTIERKEGNGSYLIFNNVPRKALLRLSHCSKNTQEHHRIFLYEDGKIIWL